MEKEISQDSNNQVVSIYKISFFWVKVCYLYIYISIWSFMWFSLDFSGRMFQRL